MSENIESKTLESLMGETDIRIPRIQRDYAQGRQQNNVEKIRRNFVQDLMAVVKGETDLLNLDFIYGSYQGSVKSRAFEPLDGQQRLTTLYLLHWLLGANLTYRFTYATRPTSNDFFLFLNSLNVGDLINEWCESNERFSDIIKNQESYRWQWQFDPTIKSVLVMLDEMAYSLGKQWLLVSRQDALRNLSKISFEYLDLEALGLQKSLYVKMNARGKQLSDFDLLKSSLEQDLLRQLSEASDQGSERRLLDVQKKWREKIDTEWNDALWHVYARNEIAQTLNLDIHSEQNREKRKNKAFDIEDRLKRLILVFISRQLYISEDPEISELAYRRKVPEMLSTLDAYMQAHHRKDIQVSLVNLDYDRIIEDIDALLSFITDEGDPKPVILTLKETSLMEENRFTYLDRLTAFDRAVDDIAILHAIIEWLRANPCQNKDLAAWIKDFNDWARFVRNVLANNNNYNRLDGSSDLRAAIKGIDMMIHRWFSPQGADHISVVERISRLPEATAGVYTGLDNASINEEREKAALKDDPSWMTLITEAENQPYIWGQIRWLLRWSEVEDRFDKELFADYSRRFEALRLFATGEYGAIFRTAMLISSYDDLENTDFRTFMFNEDRDNSVKYYLRYKNGIFGDRFKKFIDQWKVSGYPDNIELFCKNLIAGIGEKSPLWLQALCVYPEMVTEDVTHYIVHIERGHTGLLRKKTMVAGYNDPVLRYLDKKLYQKHKDDIEQRKLVIKYCNSKQETPNRIILYSMNSDRDMELLFSIYWGEGEGEYVLESGGQTHVLSNKEIIELSFLDQEQIQL